MKVKIIREEYHWDLEKEINEFINGKIIIDIKYSIAIEPNFHSAYSAMIIYH